MRAVGCFMGTIYMGEVQAKERSVAGSAGEEPAWSLAAVTKEGVLDGMCLPPVFRIKQHIHIPQKYTDLSILLCPSPNFTVILESLC